MQIYLTSSSVSEAEVFWCLHIVMTHSSLRTGATGTNLFPIMFSDSNIAKSMHLAKDKIKYITYCISVHFASELVKILAASSFYSISFDEFLNKIMQRGQMDILVCFMQGNKVITRYLTLVFLSIGRAEDLLYRISTNQKLFRYQWMAQM